jgi:hypothetical protein
MQKNNTDYMKFYDTEKNISFLFGRKWLEPEKSGSQINVDDDDTL